MKDAFNPVLRALGHVGPPTPPVDMFIRSVVDRFNFVPGPTAVRSRFGAKFRVFDHTPKNLTNCLDFSLYYFGTWEPHLARVISRFIRPGMTCVDAGANVGWYTLLFASMVGATGRVFAFEPDPRAFATLSANLAVNGDPENILTFQAALGDDVGAAQFQLAASALYSSLSPRQTGVDSIVTEIHTVDGLRVPNGIDFIKIDVEGGEWNVLRGGSETLSRDRPTLQIEINPETSRANGYSPAQMLRWLSEEFGYRFVRPTRLGQLRSFDPAQATILTDIFAIAD